MSLIFYHREDCHLCEQALALLCGADLQHDLALVDIDTDLHLGIEYGLRIPVIANGKGDQLDWPFDVESVRALMG